MSNKPKEQVVAQAVTAFEKRNQGAKVEVEYIPVETRAQRVKAAFNDPRSAPDLIEYGNTDTAGYVKDGGLADISAEFAAWDEAKDTDPTARKSVTVGGKVYGSPLFVGLRALYYRTDVFKELGLTAPKSQAELVSTAKKIRKAKPELYGIAVGGAYTYGAMPFVWAAGGELATEEGGSYKAAVNSEAAREGIATYASLFGDDNCPAAKCAQMGGNATVTAFASGKAAMAIGGDFSHAAVEAGTVKGKYAVVPLPGTAPGFDRPGLRRRQQHRRPQEHLAPHPRRRPPEVPHRQGHPGQALRRDGLPAHLHRRTGRRRTAPALREALHRHPSTPAPGSSRRHPAGTRSDSSLVLPTMFQEVVSGRKDVKAAADDAAKKMDAAFAPTS
ncbi:ABC transporter substrate-binding protein [Streptomyces narbonensis]